MSNCCLFSSIVWSFSLNISANFLFSSFWFSITFKSSSFLLCSNSWLFSDSCNWFCNDLFNDWRENTVRQNRSNDCFPNLKNYKPRKELFLKKERLKFYWFFLTIICLSVLILNIFFKKLHGRSHAFLLRLIFWVLKNILMKEEDMHKFKKSQHHVTPMIPMILNEVSHSHSISTFPLGAIAIKFGIFLENTLA